MPLLPSPSPSIPFFYLDRLVRAHHHSLSLQTLLKSGKLFSSANRALSTLNSTFCPAFASPALLSKIKHFNSGFIQSQLLFLVDHYHFVLDDALTHLKSLPLSLLLETLPSVFKNIQRKTKLSSESRTFTLQTLYQLQNFPKSSRQSYKIPNLLDLKPRPSRKHYFDSVFRFLDNPRPKKNQLPKSLLPTPTTHSNFMSKPATKKPSTSNTSTTTTRLKPSSTSTHSTLTTSPTRSTPTTSSTHPAHLPLLPLTLHLPLLPLALHLPPTLLLPLPYTYHFSHSPSPTHPAPTTSPTHPAPTTSPIHLTPTTSTTHPAPTTSPTHLTPTTSTTHPAPTTSPTHPATTTSPTHSAPTTSPIHSKPYFPQPETQISVFHRKGRSTTHWTLPALKDKTVFIGDSNLSRLQRLPDQCHAFSFGGANIDHLHSLISKYTHTQFQPTNILFSVGINNRDQNPAASSIPSFKKLISKTHAVFPNARIHVASINFSPNLTSTQRNNLKTLNSALTSIPHCHVIPPLDSHLFSTGSDNIHWSSNTASNFRTHWLLHLNY